MNQTNNNGFEFLEFIRINEGEMYKYKPLAGSFAVVVCEGKYLICFNKWRSQWELPAGRREGEETPKECAMRELYEETGQMVSNLVFKGLLKAKNQHSGKVKYNPVYSTAIDRLQPFRENEETTEIRLWDLREDIGCFDEVDMRIFDYI
ncbi:NUDIX domain-containing protein [Planomicrobium sp. CPCC 101079]|uniref:NUDIX domain-containing protein n=1 Tax=Planomicrobium sp. CPCC 101079 TaxID=2599618 RepID=UPI0011B7A9DB|nr:NUDIX hydrolase [Planomicrobium sp. CPCC 101079]TWT02529.1 NUDIX hydrolase [Planomicrobium sp. CPCC 101079]